MSFCSVVPAGHDVGGAAVSQALVTPSKEVIKKNERKDMEPVPV
jgi:hypothetical protein